MFFFIGASRTGSTWLARALRTHPEIRLPINKPARFWNQKIFGIEDQKSNYPTLTLDEYLELYQPEPGILKGDMTDGYNILGVTEIKAIKRYFPSAKILFFMRDPREIAESHFKLHKSGADLTVDDVVQQLESPAGYQYQNIRQVSCYDRWAGVFGEDQVRVFFYDEFFADTAKGLRNVLEFLQVSTEYTVPKKLRAITNARVHNDSFGTHVEKAIDAACAEPSAEYRKFKAAYKISESARP